jgi:hypothetical protein
VEPADPTVYAMEEPQHRIRAACSTGQETVLAVEISRDGFERALRHACLSSYVRGVHPERATWQRQLKRAPTRVQWDPERDLHLRPLPYRSLQLGLSGEAVRRHADERTVAIRDVTPLAHEIHALVNGGELDSATRLPPQELPYPAGDEPLAHLLERRADPPDSRPRPTGHTAAQARRDRGVLPDRRGVGRWLTAPRPPRIRRSPR